MNPIHVVALDHGSPDVAGAIRAVMSAAYRVEADILGVADFVPLRRTTAEIAGAETRFFGISLDDGLAAVAELEDRQPGLCQISALVVTPSHFREGLATALLHEVIGARPECDITVSTGVLNGPALRLYAAHAFRSQSRWATRDGIPMVTLVRTRDAGGPAEP